MSSVKRPLLRVLFDGPPSHESGRFVECEDADGKSVNCGEWLQEGDLWVLAVTRLPEAEILAQPCVRDALAKQAVLYRRALHECVPLLHDELARAEKADGPGDETFMSAWVAASRERLRRVRELITPPAEPGPTDPATARRIRDEIPPLPMPPGQTGTIEDGYAVRKMLGDLLDTDLKAWITSSEDQHRAEKKEPE